jgi:hypothetical protein
MQGELDFQPKQKLSRQQKAVLSRLQREPYVPAWKFMRLDYIFRPSERIRELKAKGYDIVNLNVAESGNPSKGVAVYQLKKEA